MYKFQSKTFLNYQFTSKNLHNVPFFTNRYNKLQAISKNKRIMIHKTRGVPSSSSNLKEVLTEKIPIYYDVLRNFRREYGKNVVNKITVNDMYSGLSGMKTIIKETADTHPKFGVTYRGVTMPGIINLLPHRGHFPSPESIFWLLLTGDVPTESQTRSLTMDWASRREKRNNWLTECQIILKALPQRLGPLEKLSIILMSLDSTDKHFKDSLRTKIMSHEQWEYTFEDGMDLLAVLPSFLGLLKTPSEFIVSSTSIEKDWVDLFMEYLENAPDNSKSIRTSLDDFLRLFIALNADDNGGIPSLHVSQILGSSQHEFGKVIAGLILASTNEPSSGTLKQCQNFQEKIQRLLGPNPQTNILKGLVRAFIEKSNNSLPGYEKSNYPNLGYHVLHTFANDIASQDPQVKLSMEITNVVDSIPQENEEHFVPEKNSIICPLLKFHGLNDMEFNQGLVCMSRALGAVASIIWSRIINLPVENPQSCSTHNCIELMKKKTGESRRDKVILIPKK